MGKYYIRRRQYSQSNVCMWSYRTVKSRFVNGRPTCAMKKSLWNKSCLKLDSKREAGLAHRKVAELERQWWWLLVMETSILGRRRRVSVAGGKRGISVHQTLSDFCIAAFSLAFIYIFLLSFLALLRLIWDDSCHVDDLKWPIEQRRACKGLNGRITVWKVKHSVAYPQWYRTL